MRLFSHRKGLKQADKFIQIDNIDADLRSGLWNALLIAWNAFEEKQFRENLRLLILFFPYWDLYFKRPVDTIPNNFVNVISVFRKHHFNCQWDEVYDFLEFTAKHYPYDDNSAFVSFANDVLERENSAYRFIGNEIAQITSEAEIESINNALDNTKDLTGVNLHLTAALEHLSDRKNPDFRNSIKESISAVEAACIEITDDPQATLGVILRTMERNGDIHGALSQSFRALYGYTSDADGIRHALMDEPNLSYIDAKYMYVACTAFVNYLVVKAGN